MGNNLQFPIPELPYRQCKLSVLPDVCYPGQFNVLYKFYQYAPSLVQQKILTV